MKVFIRSQSIGKHSSHELNTYQQVARISSRSRHPGRKILRALLDSFIVAGPNGERQCLVHPPLWETIDKFIDRTPIRCLPPAVLVLILFRLFWALDFLHTDCHLDLNGKISEHPVLQLFLHANDWHVQQTLKSTISCLALTTIRYSVTSSSKNSKAVPSPRKEVGGRFIYLSRQLDMPGKLGPPVLCDVGSVAPGD